MTIIAVNGYRLEELGDAVKMFDYLLTSEIRELTVLDGKMNLYRLSAE